ncbi:MAG: hypothetical protein ACJASQ_003670 [Crocinitomicaceae bacterium]|jgi:hypothetical protein
MKLLIVILAAILLTGCNKKKFFDGPNTFSEDFESYSVIEDIVEGDDLLWSFFQQTYDENTITIDTNIYHSGGQSVRSYAIAPTGDGTSKASINKQNMAFWSGETVQVDFWVYLEGNDPMDWLFIFDIEEQTAVGAGPGMRLAIVENKILLEHKYLNPNVLQLGEGIEFPRDQWVNIRFEAKLSQKKKGWVKVWQDGTLIIDQDKWKTLPKDILYFQQGTKEMYSQIEFGATANSDDNDVVIYVDDIDVSIAE